MGVFGMLLPAERGGFGGGAIEAAVVFEQLGAHLATGPVLWSTIAAPLRARRPRPARSASPESTLASSPRAPFVIEHAAESDVVVVVRDDGVTSFAASALPEPLTRASRSIR